MKPYKPRAGFMTKYNPCTCKGCQYGHIYGKDMRMRRPAKKAVRREAKQDIQDREK